MPNCLATRTTLASANAPPPEANHAAVATTTVRRRSIKILPIDCSEQRSGSLDQTIHHRLGTAIASGHYPAQTGGRMAQGTSMQSGANAPLLAVDDVTLQYKTEQHLVTATFRVGFEVYEGERYVVLGPS